MRQVYPLFIILSLLLFGCTLANKEKESEIKYEKRYFNVLKQKDTVDFVPSVPKKEEVLISKNRFVENDKQYNITYKGKDRNHIVKAADIFKNVHYVPLETNDVSLLNPNH